MARTTGPLFSQEASGTVGKLITHSSWKGRSYARQAVVPTNPNSPAQVASRTTLGWLTREWAGPTVTLDKQQSWETEARTQQVPPFNAYLKQNLERWSRGRAPMVQANGDDSGNAALLTGVVPTFTPAVRSVVIAWTVTNPRDGWGIFFYREPGPTIGGIVNTLVVAANSGAVGSHQVVDGPLAPGQYTYRFARNTKFGKYTVIPTTSFTVVVP